jgi:hypothetical protein
MRAAMAGHIDAVKRSGYWRSGFAKAKGCA